MFGKKKRSAEGGAEHPKDRKQHNLALIDREKVEMDARNAMEDRGCPTTTAVITSVELRDEMIDPPGEEPSLDRLQEYGIEADVTGADGQASNAGFSIYLEIVGDPPEAHHVAAQIPQGDDLRALGGAGGLPELWRPCRPINRVVGSTPDMPDVPPATALHAGCLTGGLGPPSSRG